MHRTLNSSRRRHGGQCLAFLVGISACAVAAANPSGVNVVHGRASFAMPNPHTLEITNSPSAILNWQSFNIGAGETTRFIQESAQSAVLNRVVGGDPSALLGNLLSNGRVFLINEAGILIGRDAVIDTAGLVMSTLQISDADFLAGRLRFEGDAGNGGIVNHGYIKTGPGGEIILIAPNIRNETLPGNPRSGLIESPDGELVLAAGTAITIASLDHPDITFDVRAPENETVNLGRLLAQGGSIHVLAGSIHQGGNINADAITHDAAGNIVLAASSRVYLDSGSTVSASSTTGEGGTVAIRAGAGDGEGRVYALGSVAADGDVGGAVAIESDRVLLTGALSARGEQAGGQVVVDADIEVIATASARLDADSTSGAGGTVAVDGGTGTFSSGHMTATGTSGGRIEVLGDEVKLAAATLDASGTNGGGTVRVGGGFQGGEDLHSASTTIVNAATVIKADATQGGNGGDVVVWADGTTVFEGIVSARGGDDFGNGGQVEVSGKENLGFYGQVDVSAANGEAGTLLLDPKNIVFTDQDVPVGVATFGLLDPHPGLNNNFGQSTQFFFDGVDFTTFSRIAVFDQFDDFGGADAGAVYLYRLSDGALLSALTGSNAGDRVGNNTLSSVAGVSVLRSTLWNGGAGALTVFNTTSGVNGTLSAANSLVGANPGDQIGSAGVQTLGTSIAVRSPEFGGTRGAVTIMAPSALRGTVGAGNSLVGANTGDRVGDNSFQGIGSGNFVLRSAHGGAGAVTFINPTSAPRGVVSATNSLVGSTPTDAVGSAGIFGFGSHYAVRSPGWSTQAGAFTVASSTTGIVGTVSAANSLVGGAPGDLVGDFSPQNLFSGRYALRSDMNGLGAVTVFDPASPPVGVVSAANSLIGVSSGDGVGSGGLQFLGSSTWAVLSSGWDGAGTDRGAVSFLDAATGNFAGTMTAFQGAVDASNSLVGGSDGDEVGSNGLEFVAGSLYAVLSPNHDNVSSGNVDTGALTWYTPGSTLAGLVDGSNSLLGIQDDDLIGSFSHYFQSLSGGGALYIAEGYNLDAGAVVFIDPSAPVVGDLDTSTALVGATAGDRIGSGGLYYLNNGNVIVHSPDFNGGAGAVTYFDLTAGELLDGSSFIGTVNATNSLVGADPGDGLGSGGISILNDHYIVLSPLFGTSFEGGAVTVVDANAGLAGVVDNTNSLVGANFGDRVGSGGLYFLGNGNVLVRSPDYNDGAGAITYIDLNGGNIFGESGFGAVIDVDNSLIGNSDDSGPIGAAGIDEFFAGGNHYYAIFSPDFDGGAGAVTFVDANIGAAGDLDSTNSLVGSNSGDAIGLFANYDFLPNDNIVLLNPQWNGNRGAATFIDLVGGMGLTGVIDNTNSVVGTTAGDRVGGDGVTSLFGSNTYAILSPEWSNGGATAAGAITWGDIDTGVVGDVGLGNSLVGVNTNDRVGDCCNINFLTGTTWYVRTQTFDANRSALTFFDPNGILPVGAIDASNSLLGSTAGDNLGSGGIFTVNTTSGTRIVIESPNWDNGAVVDAGAITTFLEASPLTGPLDASNSFVGSNANDRVGSGFLSGLSNGNRLIVTNTWNGNAGAVTFWNPNNALTGVLGAGNSLVGGSAGDNIGSFGVTEFSGSGRYYVLSPSWNGNMGAITFGSITTGVAGLVSAANSLVGSTAGDRIGQEVYTTGGRLMVVSDTWNASRGAVTVLNPNAPRVGALTSANSLVGSNPGDRVGDFVQFLFTAGNAGRFALRTTTWNSNAGAVTIFDPLAPLTGTVSAANSLVGRPGDRVGSNGVTELGNGGLLVRSSEWSDGQGLNFGAVTLMLPNSSGRVQPVTGFVSSGNSLVGSRLNDLVGNSSPTFLPSGNLLLRSLNWFDNRGAVTFIDVTKGINGQVSASNSLVGALAGDSLGSGGITLLGGERALVRSPVASVNGIAGAGRLDVIDAGTRTPFTGNVGFGADPGGELLVSIASLVNLLNTGATLTLQANNDIILGAGLSIIADRGGLFLEAGRSIDVRGNLIVREGVISLLANAQGGDSANRDAGEGNIFLQASDKGLRIVASTLILDAQNIFVAGGETAGAHAALIGLGSTSIHAHGSGLLRLEAGTAAGTSLPLGASADILQSFLLNPETITAPIAVVIGGGALSVLADDVQIVGGGSDGAFAALASFGEFNVDAIRIDLRAGSAANADALLLGLGGVANINFQSCEGCTELLFDPLADGLAQTGIYVSGIFQEPTVDAILAMLDREAADAGEEDEEEEEEEDVDCN